MKSVRPPASYRIVRFLVDFRLVAGSLVIATAFWAQSGAPGNRVRDGVIQGLGWEPEQFGAKQAGEVLGYLLIPIILLVVMRWAVSRGKVLGYRCLQVFDMFLALSLGSVGFLLGLTGFILSFRSTYVEHSTGLRDDTPSLKAA